MQKPILIEVAGRPLGIVVATPLGFRFVAVKFPVFPIDGTVFPSVDAAREAAARLLPDGEPDNARSAA